jgi:peptidyl-prolyl cis-trans isomerase A (cyclophilin A)
MKRLVAIILQLVIFLQFGCKSTADGNPHVEIETKFGTIELELYPDKAPKTVAVFLANTGAGTYESASFYRVLNEDNQPSDALKPTLIQGGIYKKKINKDKIPFIQHETTQQSGILHTNGVISMARLEPGTASTEFFICIGDQHGFDFGGPNNKDV